MSENKKEKDVFKEKSGPVRDLDIKTEIFFTPKDHPAGKLISIFAGGKDERILIPLDVKNGDIVKITGKGNYDPGTQQSGDLYVTVHIAEKKNTRKLLWLLAVLLAAALCVVLLLVLGSGSEEQPTEPTDTDPVTVAPTDTEPADTETMAGTCSHHWVFVDCTQPKVCSECGETDSDIAGHIWTEADYNQPKTCVACGATEGEKKTPSASVSLREMVADVSASSVYAGDNLGRHSPEKLFDGKLDTNWTEDAAGNGVGEYVTFLFDDVYAVKKLRIYIGSHYNQQIYNENCRPKTITLAFSDGSTQVIHLEDTYDEQIITLDKYYYTYSIVVTIDEVYTGTKYLDTVIAELDFVAYRR